MTNKELAEWSAEFLEKHVGYPTIQRSINGLFLSLPEWHLLGNKEEGYWRILDGVYSPLLMHLSKREMEKRGFTYSHFGGGLHIFTFTHDSLPDMVGKGLSKNEYIAFWTAVRETLK